MKGSGRAHHDGLARLDDLAARLLGDTTPLRVGIARTEAERIECYRLRYDAVVRRRWADPADYPDGLERDAYDDVALHLVGWLGDRLAATARLVLPRPGIRLPTEEAFGDTIEPAGRVADLGRMTVAKDVRGGQNPLVSLLALGWRTARENGALALCAALTRSMTRLYDALGIPVAVVGPPRRYWGRDRYPIVFDADARPRIDTTPAQPYHASPATTPTTAANVTSDATSKI